MSLRYFELRSLASPRFYVKHPYGFIPCQNLDKDDRKKEGVSSSVGNGVADGDRTRDVQVGKLNVG